MIRALIVVSLSACLLGGCGGQKRAPAVITVDDTVITKDEFDEAFRKFSYTAENTKPSKIEFLDVLVTRLLLLKEAERLGLDKDPAFLKDVESFRQQSLIRLVMDRKTKSLFSGLEVNAAEIRDYYDRNKALHFQDKDLGAVYDEIHRVLLNQKQQEAVNAWIDDLKQKAAIRVDTKGLGLTGGGGRHAD